jgi:tetratricopeptide (TPR) repeat protein
MFAWILLSGCGPKIELEVMEPAEVDVPQTIRRVGVLDRSSARGLGESVLGVLEAAASGETLEADRNGRAAALQALVDVLRASPRYDHVELLVVHRRASGTSLFEREVDWRAAREIAGEAGVDAIVALEAFDSDTRLHAAPETGAEETQSWSATRKTDVLTSWRLYEPGERRVVDVLRETRTARAWNGEGATRAAALAALPDARNTVISVAGLAGEAYARRIGPATVLVVRRYYARGDDRLEAARASVRAGDWDGAAAQWEAAAASDDPKVRGRARFDLALRREVQGDLRGAIDLARQAAVDLDNGRARAYLAELERRRVDAQRVEAQVSGVTGP